MLLLDESAVHQRLSYQDLIPAIAQALADLSAGKVVQPVRVVLPIAPHAGFFGVMPAYAGGGALGAKLVTFYPQNTGIHTHHALIVMFKAVSGEPLAVLDGRLIIEDAPDTAAVIAAIGGGGLITGLASAMKALKPEIRVWGAEPETAAPAARSFATGSAQAFPEWQATFVDGAGGKSVFPRMWQRMQPVVDGCIVVSLDEVKRAMRLIAEKARVIAEGAGALGLAAALTGKAGQGPVVAVVSGGNIDLEKFSELIATA